MKIYIPNKILADYYRDFTGLDISEKYEKDNDLIINIQPDENETRPTIKILEEFSKDNDLGLIELNLDPMGYLLNPYLPVKQDEIIITIILMIKLYLYDDRIAERLASSNIGLLSFLLNEPDIEHDEVMTSILNFARDGELEIKPVTYYMNNKGE